MDDRELEKLLDDLEADRVERKASFNRDRFCETICAFANDFPNHQQPGVLFVGVNDNGSCANLPINDQLLLKLSGLRENGNILPFPTMIVQKRNLKGCEMAVIIVEPSDAPPVRFSGRTWIRVGSQRAIATQEEERRLTEKRRSKILSPDLQPMPFATLDDLDQDLFCRTYIPSVLPPDILEQNGRTVEQQLRAMRFTTIEQPPCPTILGLLVTGKDPQQYIPGAYVQFVRFDGKDITDPIKDQQEISGPLSDLLKILDETFKAHISVALDITSHARETRRPDYPIEALQQLARNAILHRTYEGTNAPVRIYWFSDRIEIQNPGGPYGQVNRNNFGTGITDYRNPYVAEAMKNLGYVQRFGIGIQLARKALEKNGNPPPEFQPEDAAVLVIVRKSS